MSAASNILAKTQQTHIYTQYFESYNKTTKNMIVHLFKLSVFHI